MQNGIKIVTDLPKRLPSLAFPQLPHNSPSLLKKHMSESLWKELRVVKTKYGGRLANCTVAGVHNPLLPVGIYACDDDAYFRFRKFFEPVVKDLHDYDMKAEALITHNFDVKGLDWNKLERMKYCIKFVQASASRNVDGYPFVPILDTSSKVEIENKLKKEIMVECESKLSVNFMTDLERKRFLDEGLMFERHPGLDDIVTTAKANEGCSIYYNTDLSEVAWINADDHVQYFVIHKGNPDLQAVCTRLFSRLRALEASVPVCHDKNLGYLTCNPANLGTALKVRVIVQLEKSADESIRLEAINSFLQARGVTVKQITHAMYEVALVKSFQLGKTESDMIAGLIDCLYELLRNEEKMLLTQGEAMNSQKEDKKFPKFDEVNTSLIRPFITPEIWEKYSKLTTRFGHTLEDCIKPGIANHKIGLIAADAECYSTFEELFTTVVQVYHEDYARASFQLSPPDLKAFAGALQRFSSVKYLVDGYLMWQGNMTDQSFPPGLNKNTRQQSNAFLLSFLDPLIKEYNLKEESIEENEEVRELLYFIDLMAEKSKITELSLNWPEQRSLFRDTTGRINLLTNVMNQVTVAVAVNTKDLASSVTAYFEFFAKLVLQRFESWAFSEAFGFYETVPADVGNGFSVKVALRLPNPVETETYMGLASSRSVMLSLDEGIVYLMHKHKFKSPSECILDVMEVASAISREEMLIDIFTTELLKECENTKTSKGVTRNDILATTDPDDPNIILIEGTESFTVFNKLYTNALKKATYGDFDLSSFNYNLSAPLLQPLELPAIPAGGVGKVIEVSRNFSLFPFPAFMKAEDRVSVTKALFPVLTALEVRRR